MYTTSLKVKRAIVPFGKFLRRWSWCCGSGRQQQCLWPPQSSSLPACQNLPATMKPACKEKALFSGFASKCICCLNEPCCNKFEQRKANKEIKITNMRWFRGMFCVLRKASQTSDRLYTHRELSLGSGTSTSMAMPAMPPSKSSSIMMAESRTLRGPCAELPTRGRTFTEAHIFQKPDVLQQALLGGLGPMSKFEARWSRPSARTCSLEPDRMQNGIVLTDEKRWTKNNACLVIVIKGLREAINTMVWTSLFGVRQNIPNRCRNVGNCRQCFNRNWTQCKWGSDDHPRKTAEALCKPCKSFLPQKQKSIVFNRGWHGPNMSR